MCAAGAGTARCTRAGITVGTATRYVAVIGSDRPSTHNTAADTTRVSTRFPWPSSRMRLETLRPSPVCRRTPTMIPATAVVAATPSTCFVPEANAATILRNDSAVSRRMYDTAIAVTIDQNTAVIVVNPTSRNAMIAKRLVYWYQYRA